MTVADSYLRVNQIAESAGGRRPSGARVLSTNSDIPTNATDGVSLGVLDDGSGGRTIVAQVAVWCREVAHTRTVYVAWTAADTENMPNGDYVITINGTAYTYTASGTPTLATVYTGLKALIDAGNVVTATVTDMVLPSDGETPALRLRGDASGDYSVDVTEPGTATPTIEADPISITATVWLQPGTENDEVFPWVSANGLREFYVGPKGLGDTFDVRSWRRAYVQFEDLAGHADDDAAMTYYGYYAIRPCGVEGS